MPALPPDRPRGLPPAPGRPTAGEADQTGTADAGQAGRTGTADAGEAGRTGTADAGYPHPPARPRSPAGPRPLPDAEAVRLCLIPDSAPPYDAEVAAPGPPGEFPRLATGPDGTGPGGTGPGSTRGAPGPSGPDSPGQEEAPGRARPRKPPAAPGPPARPGPPAAPPGWPGRFAQVLAETLAGSRPPRQLVPWTTERARDRIQRLGPLFSAGQQPRVRRVVIFHPTADAMEVAVVVVFGQRVHALALRLERDGGQASAGRAAQPGRWLCVAVEAA
jgi:hypothetical protein